MRANSVLFILTALTRVSLGAPVPADEPTTGIGLLGNEFIALDNAVGAPVQNNPVTSKVIGSIAAAGVLAKKFSDTGHAWAGDNMVQIEKLIDGADTILDSQSGPEVPGLKREAKELRDNLNNMVRQKGNNIFWGGILYKTSRDVLAAATTFNDRVRALGVSSCSVKRGLRKRDCGGTKKKQLSTSNPKTNKKAGQLGMGGGGANGVVKNKPNRQQTQLLPQTTKQKTKNAPVDLDGGLVGSQSIFDQPMGNAAPVAPAASGQKRKMAAPAVVSQRSKKQKQGGVNGPQSSFRRR